MAPPTVVTHLAAHLARADVAMSESVAPFKLVGVAPFTLVGVALFALVGVAPFALVGVAVLTPLIATG